jgi:hypothetical protein
VSEERGLNVADSAALEALPDIRATARLRGLRVSSNTYLNTRLRPPRQVAVLMFRRPSGGKALLTWWPSWGRARTIDDRLLASDSWSAALELAVELMQLADAPVPAGRP